MARMTGNAPRSCTRGAGHNHPLEVSQNRCQSPLPGSGLLPELRKMASTRRTTVSVARIPCSSHAAPAAATATATADLGPAAVTARTPASKGILKIILIGAGTYTVIGKGFRKSASVSKRFKVRQGKDRVRAPGGSVNSRRVMGRRGAGEGHGALNWSPDGTLILFSSEASNLVADDTHGRMDIFVKTVA